MAPPTQHIIVSTPDNSKFRAQHLSEKPVLPDKCRFLSCRASIVSKMMKILSCDVARTTCLRSSLRALESLMTTLLQNLRLADPKLMSSDPACLLTDAVLMLLHLWPLFGAPYPNLGSPYWNSGSPGPFSDLRPSWRPEICGMDSYRRRRSLSCIPRSY